MPGGHQRSSKSPGFGLRIAYPVSLGVHYVHDLPQDRCLGFIEDRCNGHTGHSNMQKSSMEL